MQLVLYSQRNDKTMHQAGADQMTDEYLDPNAIDLRYNTRPDPTNGLPTITEADITEGATDTTPEIRTKDLPTIPEIQKIGDGRKRALLRAYQETGNISASCGMAEVDRTTHYRWLEADQDYADAFTACREGAIDRLEREAYRRAVEGVREPTGWYKGAPGGYVQRYSDTLSIFLLKGLKPDVYGDKMEVRGAMAKLDLAQLPDHLLERIANGEHPLAVLASASEVPEVAPTLELGSGANLGPPDMAE